MYFKVIINDSCQYVLFGKSIVYKICENWILFFMLMMVQLSEAKANAFCPSDYDAVICAILLTGRVSHWWLTSHYFNNESYYAMFDHKDC